MVFDSAEAVAFVAWAVFIWWEPSRADNANWRKYYKDNQKDVSLAKRIPARIFGLVWFILKFLLVIAAYYYFSPGQFSANDPAARTDHFLTTFVLWVVNEMLRKYWSVLFMDMRKIGWALLVAVGIVATGVALLVFLGMSTTWLSFGLVVPYVLWAGFAVVLNAQWYQRVGRDTRKQRMRV